MFKKIIIDEIIVEGFKIYKDKKTIRFSDITRISGGNGIGKTSVAEAITWCFLGSDLWGNTKKDSLLLNKKSKRMEVRIKFSDGINNHTIIRNRYRDKTSIFFDNKDIKQYELNNLLGSKDIFLSIFNPMYFLKLSEKDARDLIIPILPGVDQEEVLEKMDEYEISIIKDDIEKIHANPNLYMKEKREKIKEYEKDILFNKGVLSSLSIPQQVGELKDFNSSELESLENELDRLYQSKATPNSNLISKMQKLSNQRLELEREIATLSSKEFSKIDNSETLKEIFIVEKNIEIAKAEEFKPSDKIIEMMATLKADINILGEEYLKTKEIPIQLGSKCPICRTIIDEFHLGVLKEEIYHELSKIVESGKAKKEELNDLEQSLLDDKDRFEREKGIEINNLKESHLTLTQQLEKIEKVNTENMEKFNYNKQQHIGNLRNKIRKIEDIIEKMHLDSEGDFKAKQASIKEKIVAIKKEKAIIDAYNIEIKLLNEKKENDMKRQREIIEESEKLNTDINLCKSQITTCQRYTSLKIKILSDFIHQHLENVVIKLQKIIKTTGELKDCFEVQYTGKDLEISSEVISTAEEIKTGLEISNLISSITSLNYPIFIDNLESITNYKICNRQVIEAKVVADIPYTIETFDNTKIAIYDNYKTG